MATCGLLAAGPLFVRADRLERLAAAARRLARQGPFQATPDLAAAISAKPRDLAGVLAALGYTVSGASGALSFTRGPERRGSKRRRHARPASPHSPFAELRRLVRS
jgi:ATP-dependent RNA helicase SUPV3L1/SUV3